jgi:hypothetical protein
MRHGAGANPAEAPIESRAPVAAQAARRDAARGCSRGIGTGRRCPRSGPVVRARRVRVHRPGTHGYWSPRPPPSWCACVSELVESSRCGCASPCRLRSDECRIVADVHLDRACLAPHRREEVRATQFGVDLISYRGGRPGQRPSKHVAHFVAALRGPDDSAIVRKLAPDCLGDPLSGSCRSRW